MVERLSKRALAAALGAFILFIAVGSVCAPLHEKVHAASPGHAEHACAFCLFLNGQVNSADTSAIKPGFVCLNSFSPTPAVTVAVSYSDIRLMPSRAPPSPVPA